MLVCDCVVCVCLCVCLCGPAALPPPFTSARTCGRTSGTRSCHATAWMFFPSSSSRAPSGPMWPPPQGLPSSICVYVCGRILLVGGCVCLCVSYVFAVCVCVSRARRTMGMVFSPGGGDLPRSPDALKSHELHGGVKEYIDRQVLCVCVSSCSRTCLGY